MVKCLCQWLWLNNSSDVISLHTYCIDCFRNVESVASCMLREVGSPRWLIGHRCQKRQLLILLKNCPKIARHASITRKPGGTQMAGGYVTLYLTTPAITFRPEIWCHKLDYNCMAIYIYIYRWVLPFKTGAEKIPTQIFPPKLFVGKLSYFYHYQVSSLLHQLRKGNTLL